MDVKTFPSRLLENAVHEFSKLPGIGQKTAMRLVLNLLKQDKSDVLAFGNSIIDLRENVKFCKQCNNISDTDICEVCSSLSRNRSLICVVENVKEVMAVEHTQQYNGLYHVLGGVISPMDGIGPGDLSVSLLEQRVANGDIGEVVFALSTTMEGDTTNFYLYKKLRNYSVKISTLARGVAIGDELEYADEITLGRSIINRTLFEETILG